MSSSSLSSELIKWPQSTHHDHHSTMNACHRPPAAGDQKALWRISKDLLHNDDRPPEDGTLEANLLCDQFPVFFADKLKLIASTICTRLQGVADYYLQPTCRKSPTMMVALGSHGRGGVATNRRATGEDVDTGFHVISLMKSCADEMAPVIAGLANRSFSTGVFPSTLKHGRVTPLLKKPGLKKTAMTNYRPITNLSTLSKLLERLVLSRLRPHVLRPGISASFIQPIDRAIQLKLLFSESSMMLCETSTISASPFCLHLTFPHRLTHQCRCSSRPSEGGFWHRWRRSRVAALVLDRHNSVRRSWFVSFYIRCMLVWRSTRQRSWSTAVRVVHFASRQRRYCTSPTSPPVSIRHSALHGGPSRRQLAIGSCISMWQRCLALVPGKRHATQSE